MQLADRPAFADLLTQALAFYRQDVTTFTLDVWWEACKGVALEQVRKALTAHALDPDRGQFPPKPADLVRQLRGTHTDRALMAWGLVFDAMSSVGAYASPNLGDPIAHAVIVDMGGWTTICRSDLDDLPFTQKRFCDTYRTYAARGDVSTMPQRLIGESEATNAALGHSLAPAAPRLENTAARAILERSSPRAIGSLL
jgi:hypothetical protein